MKIYVITKGSYSDYHICAVTTDKEKAERLVLFYTDRWDEAKIEEFEEDEIPDDYMPIYFVQYKNGKWCVNKRGIGSPDYEYEHAFFDRDYIRGTYDFNCFYCDVMADDEEHAIKIARDLYAKKKAELMGL